MAAAASRLRKQIAGLTAEAVEGRRWRLFDCKGEVLGRLASRIAVALMGKDKPTYTPSIDDGDICVVINAKDISVFTKTMQEKTYYWHTGYVGHLRQIKLKDMIRKDPTMPIRKAVYRMMPRNRLHRVRMLKLRVFADDKHPFGDMPLQVYQMPPRKLRVKKPFVPRMVRLGRKAVADKQAAEAKEAAAAAAEAAEEAPSTT